jgi:protein-L-isoaspartate O-methyltransferase
MTYTATYSPEDNKLRLYASSRLDKETYERVRAAGFIWAPKQGLFVAPAWSPSREDLLLELCGEIGDEDTSLVERAEDRAERFEDYSESRAEDAERARAAVSAIADNIPLGQPILVGHHSEKHARKDAERVENGMRKAVRMWETSKYWTQRAAGAIRHAKYKELPAVRARRIKGLEADKRKHERTKAELEKLLKFWSKSDISLESALKIANYFDRGEVTLTSGEKHFSCWSALSNGTVTVDEVKSQRVANLPRVIAHYDRWLNHISNRLEYERAMLAESGGTEADRTKPEKGGACRCWCSWRGGYSTIQKVNKVSVSVLDTWGNGGADFPRTIPFDKLTGLMSKAEVDAARDAGRLIGETPRGFHLAGVPSPEPTKPTEAEPVPASETTERAEAFDALKQTLKAGVQVVTAPQLFPTPSDLADRMVEAADLEPGQNVLEPSAGTGAIIDAIRRKLNHGTAITAVEINPTLAHRLAFFDCLGADRVHPKDFLTCNGDLGKFDRVLMNPPFENGADIKHILHAISFLKPGGRLVALCAAGPRQNDKLRPLAHVWEELPADTFKDAGTGVRAALLVIDAPAERSKVTQRSLF